MTTFHKTLRAYRRQSGMSMSQLGRSAGMSYAVISRYESRSRQPSPEAVTALADAMSLDTADRIRLQLSAGFIPHAVTTSPDLMDAITAMILSAQPRSRTVTVEKRAA